MSGRGRGYGSRIDAPPGTAFTADFVDRDNDHVDDRYQTGPGKPYAHSGTTTSAASVSDGGFWGQIPGSTMPGDVTTPHTYVRPGSIPSALPTSSGGSGGGGNGGNSSSPSTGMTREEFLAYQARQAAISAKASAAAQAASGQSVYDWMRSNLAQWGLDDPSIISAITDSRNEFDMLTQIRDTAAYKERFAGNIARAEAGYGMLSEAQYLAMESSYRGSMHAAGLPKGFYDDPSDFAKFIAQDVSPEEIAQRAAIAGNLAQTKDPQLWKELESRGISKGDAAAYMLDPDRALPAIQHKLDSAAIGVAAREAGLTFGGQTRQQHHTLQGPAGTTTGHSNGNRFENSLVDKGITQEQARVAFDAVAQDEPGLDALAAQYGQKEFGTKALVRGELGIGGQKAKKRRRELASRERANWGSAGVGSGANTFGSTSF